MRNVVFLFGILNGAFSQNYSCNAPLIPDLPRRARNYTATGSNEDTYISDENLGPGWFSTNNYRMSDSTNIPNITQCGTEIPIYIKGKHPSKVQMPNGVQLNVTTCEKFPWDDCANERTIYVILCNRLFHYFLQQTSINSGYCFEIYDPIDDLQNLTGTSTTLNEYSSGVLNSLSRDEIIGAVVGAIAGCVVFVVIAVIAVTRFIVQRRAEKQNEERNDGHVSYNGRNLYERGAPLPAESHIYDQIYVSTTHSEHLASDGKRNDGHVSYNGRNFYERGAPLPAESHIYDRMYVSTTHSEHLASDEEKNDGHVNYNGRNVNERGAPLPAESHINDSQLLASDETG